MRTHPRVLFVAAAVWLISGALLAPQPASAGELSDVRIGEHPDYTRVVLQTDAVAGHRLDQSAREIRVQLDARATPRTIAAKGGHLNSVTVKPSGGGTEVRLQLQGPVELRTLMLREPDRLVLDLYTPGKAPGAAALAASGATKKPATAAKKPLETAAAKAPDKAAAKAPGKSTAKVPDKAAAKVPEKATARAPEKPKRKQAEATAAAKPGPAAGKTAPVAAEPKKDGPLSWEALAAADQGPAKTGSKAPGAGEPGSRAKAPGAVRPGSVAKAPSAGPAQSKVVPAPPPRATGQPEAGGIPRTTIVLGILVVLAVGGLVVLRGRRNRDAEPGSVHDAAEDASTASASEGSGIPAAIAAPDAIDRPVETDHGVAVPTAAELDQHSIFDEPVPLAETEDKDEVATASGILPGTSGSSPAVAGGPLDEFERRLSYLESRIEEVVDERERLERQVVAQTEELRVQRAAIARTQRVLRGLARPEEETSEPVSR